MYKVIGLAGPTGAGKDNIASIIASERGFIAYNMAQPMIDCLKHLFNIPVEWFDNEELRQLPFASLGISPSALMHSLEADCGRKIISEELWIRVAESHFYEISRERNEPELKIVIPRIQWENEADWIRRGGGAIIHISGSRSESESRRPDIEVKEGDFHIDGSLGKLRLYSQIERTINQIEERWA